MEEASTAYPSRQKQEDTSCDATQADVLHFNLPFPIRRIRLIVYVSELTKLKVRRRSATAFTLSGMEKNSNNTLFDVPDQLSHAKLQSHCIGFKEKPKYQRKNGWRSFYQRRHRREQLRLHLRRRAAEFTLKATCQEGYIPRHDFPISCPCSLLPHSI